MKHEIPSSFHAIALSLLLTTGAGLAQTTFSYDFNGQWNGDWLLNDPAGMNSSFNYSKDEEGRLGGAGGNALGGNIQAPPGAVGPLSVIYQPTAYDLSTTGSSIRIQQAWSAFANQPSFLSGTSEPGQIGLINNPGTTGTLSTGDSLYVGIVERSWTGQNLSAPYPGSAELEIGLFRDGAMVDSFGTFTLNDYGARVGSQVFAQWLDFDVRFENIGSGNIAYSVGVNTISYYNSIINGDPSSIIEGTPTLLFTDGGVIGGSAGLNDLGSLRVALGANITPGGDVSVTGATYDFSPSGAIVPEPTSALMLACTGLGIMLGRRRRSS